MGLFYLCSGFGGGAFAQVLTAGTLWVGDPIVWDDERL
jgi:hypothetical protein